MRARRPVPPPDARGDRLMSLKLSMSESTRAPPTFQRRAAASSRASSPEPPAVEEPVQRSRLAELPGRFSYVRRPLMSSVVPSTGRAGARHPHDRPPHHVPSHFPVRAGHRCWTANCVRASIAVLKSSV